MNCEQDRAPIKSAHSLLLNRLSQMQRAPCYATAREELALAEQTIVQLERGLNERNKKVMELQARIDELMAVQETGDRKPLIPIMD